MSPPTKQPDTVDLFEDWPLIQDTIGAGLRLSLEQVTEEQLPGAVALMLVRLAFAEFVCGIALEKIGPTAVDVTP